MDRRTFIGIIVISLLLAVMLLWSGNSQKKNAPAKAQYEQKIDSARNAQDIAEEATIVITTQQDSLSPLFPAMNGKEDLVVLDNGLLKVGITSKGATPCFASLSNYNDQIGQHVTLFGENEISLNFKIDGKNQNIQSRNLYFQTVYNGENSVIMRLNTNGYGHLDFIYTLIPESYMLNLDIKANGMENFFSSNLKTLAVDWIQNLRQQEKGFEFEQRYTTLTYKRADKIKSKVMNVAPASTKTSKTTGKPTDKTVEERLDWVAYKNQFFSCIMIASDTYAENTELSGVSYVKGLGYMKKLMAKTNVGFDPEGNQPTKFQFYFGPNDYKILKQNSKLAHGDQKVRLNRVIDLGWPVVREVNRFLIIPLFNLLSKWNLNMGLVILLMTLIVKALVFPAQVKSYMSSAKTRALKPYIDEVNAKYPKPEDAMKKQQETMAVYSKYGVSPMGGCLPSLVQMPVWMAFFFFVPNAIELRQQSFLWATDLTGFDDLISWGTNIPLIGNHLSIFCLLFCVTNVINTIYSMQQQQTVPGQEDTMKMMRWTMYLMPVIFFFSFNNYSSGLCYYYFISGLVGIITMIWLRRSTDDKAILAKLEADYEASRNDPNKRKSGGNSMMARLEALQKEQERLQKQQQQKR
ncbi:MAG: membrane protein insertase YidC [Bacteroidaceae bacterium]|nr:membrane protein insertase YidC [Bacteroidaceae bacterium]